MERNNHSKMATTTISTKQKNNCRVKCLHCDAEISIDKKFCCPGCEAAYNALNQIKISDSPIFSAFVKDNEEDNYNLTLNIEGVHCASCIQLIENALLGEKDVTSARVNMSTNRLSISWKGKKERADALAHIVIKLGYKLQTFDNSKNSKSEQDKILLKAIAVAGFAAGNLMMISVGLWSSSQEIMGIATRSFFHFISALIAIPAIMYSGRPFFKSAISVLKERRTNMDVPISIAVILASLMSLFETINHGEHIYFDSALMLLFFLLIGRYLDARAKQKARQSAEGLLSMLSGTATILKDGKQSIIPIKDLREGMIVMVASGSNIPTDGVIFKGGSDLDMSLITGETIPAHVKKDDNVYAGTVNLTKPIQIKVSKASENSLLSDIVKLMEKAEQGQAKYVRLADKAAKLYTPVVHTMGLITFLGWWLIMGMAWQPALLIAITVLIITCPCALGLAVPVVQVLASSKLMKQAILLKSGDALEKLATIDTAIFDKTGTLTLGKPELASKKHEKKDLQLAASIAAHSKHPLSIAIVNAYSGKLLEISNVKEIPGKGLEAKYDGKTIRLGSRNWCGDKNAAKTKLLELWLATGDEKTQFIFSDKLREDAKEIIAKFNQANIKTMLLSGDRDHVVKDMAKQVSIGDFHSSLTPIDKCNILEKLKEDGKNILMVGDGLNDAPALAKSDISISPSSAVDITQNTADIVFQGQKLEPIFTSWQVAKKAKILVKQNFMLAVIYNIIAIPLAVMGHVTPLIAAIAMSGSSLIVIGNSFRLNIKKD